MYYELWPKQQILATKLRVPTLAHTIIERPRLSALLDKALCHPVTVICAPPGFGKTTLVANWLQHTTDARVWVSLTERDNQPQAFWSYMFAAFDDAVLGGTNHYAALLHATQSNGIETALVQLVNALSERTEPLVVVLDNYQYITSPEINESLAFVIEHAPQHLHVILLTSHEPALPLPRWRARGLVTEVHAGQLSCTTDEASAFLAAHNCHHPNETDWMVDHAEGWFAGLRLLAAGSRHVTNLSRSPAENSGAHTYEYVQNEVLADLPDELCAFLLHTCVLDEMCPELCDAVLDAGELKHTASSYHALRKLERLNLFVVPLDDERRWYRYHRLFHNALRYLAMHNEPHLFHTVSQRASAWYQAHDQLDTAINYALRGQAWEQAATLIEQWLSDTACRRQSDKLRRASKWIAQLPTECARGQQLVQGLQATKRPAVLNKLTEPVAARRPTITLPLKETRPALFPQLAHDGMAAQELSARELEVLALIAGGASNYEIAERLTLSLHTVKRHASNILAKLNAANRTQAVALARAYGLLSLEHMPYSPSTSVDDR